MDEPQETLLAIDFAEPKETPLVDDKGEVFTGSLLGDDNGTNLQFERSDEPLLADNADCHCRLSRSECHCWVMIMGRR